MFTTMESLQNAENNFLMEIFNTKVHPGVRIAVDDSDCVVDVEFSIKDVPQEAWHKILGGPLAVIWRALEMNITLVFSLTKSLSQRGFLKAHQLHVTDEYLQLLKTKPNFEQAKFHSSSTVCYVANKAYTWTASLQAEGLPICVHKNLVIAVDPMTRKVTSLEPDFRQKFEKHIKRSGWSNQSLLVQKFDEGILDVIFAFQIEITREHMDSNNHTNYKIYIFGSVVCLRKAINAGKLSQFSGVSVDDVITRDIKIVYEKESVLGDVITFKLYTPTENNAYVVACYNADRRLAHGVYSLECIAPNTSKL